MNTALMLLLHADPFVAGAGGTEMHVLDRVATLALPRAVVVYPLTSDCIAVTSIQNGNLNEAEFLAFPLKTPLLRYAHSHPEAEDVLLRIARLFSVSAVSVEHALYFPLNAILRLKREGLRYVTIHHDFYCVCPSLNLMDIRTYTPCPAHAGEPAQAAECLRNYFEVVKVAAPCPAEAMLTAHQQCWREILEHAETCVFPSGSARDTVLQSFPNAASRAVVVPHGYAAQPALPQRKPAARLRVALIGQVAHKIKGRELILELLGRTRELPIEWHFFGDVEYLNFMSRVDELGPRRVFHGPYRRAELIPKLAAHADVALFTSVCAETFSFTLSEALLARVPAIVPRMGALAERVGAGQWGWIVDPNSAPAAATLLGELCADRAKVVTLQQHLASFRHTSLEQNAAEYQKLYAPLLAGNAPSASDSGELRAAAAEYVTRRDQRDAEARAQEPAYKRSIFYGAYRNLKHLVPVSVRNGLYRLLVRRR